MKFRYFFITMILISIFNMAFVQGSFKEFAQEQEDQEATAILCYGRVRESLEKLKIFVKLEEPNEPVNLEQTLKLKNSQRIVDFLIEVSQLKENTNYVHYLKILQKIEFEKRQRISPHFIKIAVFLENRINLNDLLEKLLSIPSNDYEFFSKLIINFKDYKGPDKFFTSAEINEIYDTFNFLPIEKRDLIILLIELRKINDLEKAHDFAFSDPGDWHFMLTKYRQNNISLQRPVFPKTSKSSNENEQKNIDQENIDQENIVFNKLIKYCRSCSSEQLKFESKKFVDQSIKDYLDQDFKRILGSYYQFYLLKLRFYELIDAMHQIYDESFE